MEWLTISRRVGERESVLTTTRVGHNSQRTRTRGFKREARKKLHVALQQIKRPANSASKKKQAPSPPWQPTSPLHMSPHKSRTGTTLLFMRNDHVSWRQDTPPRNSTSLTYGKSRTRIVRSSREHVLKIYLLYSWIYISVCREIRPEVITLFGGGGFFGHSSDSTKITAARSVTQ